MKVPYSLKGPRAGRSSSGSCCFETINYYSHHHVETCRGSRFSLCCWNHIRRWPKFRSYCGSCKCQGFGRYWCYPEVSEGGRTSKLTYNVGIFGCRRKGKTHIAIQGETKGDDDIANWQVPEELERAYPYYLSGYDDEDRPSKLLYTNLNSDFVYSFRWPNQFPLHTTVWITEFGKFKISHFISQGPEKVEEFEKYVKKAADRVIKSLSSKNKEGKELVAIIDFEDLPFNVFSQVPSKSCHFTFKTDENWQWHMFFLQNSALRLLLKLAREYRKLLEDHVHHAFVINGKGMLPYHTCSLVHEVI